MLSDGESLSAAHCLGTMPEEEEDTENESIDRRNVPMVPPNLPRASMAYLSLAGKNLMDRQRRIWHVGTGEKHSLGGRKPEVSGKIRPQLMTVRPVRPSQ